MNGTPRTREWMDFNADVDSLLTGNAVIAWGGFEQSLRNMQPQPSNAGIAGLYYELQTRFTGEHDFTHFEHRLSLILITRV